MPLPATSVNLVRHTRDWEYCI